LATTVTPPSVTSEISAVTVFRRGAIVTRTAELERNGNGFPAAVRVTGLPLATDDASVRVRVEAAQQAAGDVTPPGLPVARDLRVALEPPTQSEDGEPPEERELLEARRLESRLSTRVAQGERERARIEALDLPRRPAGEEGRPPQHSPTLARLALVEFCAERSRRLTEELLDLRDRLREATRRREELEDRFRRSSSDRRVEPHTLRKTVVVTLDEGGAARTGVQRARLLVDYQVPGARWAPSYSLRLNQDGGDAELGMRAVVAQRTGEDWNGVRLTLSTAAPESWSELPELPSLRIGRHQEPPLRLGWRPAPTGAEDLYSDWDRAFASRRRPDAAVAAKKARARKKAPPPPQTEELLIEDLALAEDEPVLEAAVAFADEEGAAALPPLTAAGAPAEAAGPPPSAALAAAARPTRAQRFQKSMPQPTAAPGIGAPETPTSVRARDDMLAYGSLRMPAADSSRRGRLVVTERIRAYQELIIERRIEVDADLLKLVDSAAQRADSAGQRLPARCRLAVSEDGFDYAYLADAPISIPSDRHYHTIGVTARSAPAQLRHVCVPREATDVFRVVELSNPLSGPLLSGPVDVYLGKQPLLTGDLATTPVEGRVVLGLGVEQGVKVSRNTRFREQTTGLTGGSLVLEHEIDVDVHSHLGHPIALEVRERTPVSREDDSDISVELGNVIPKWQSYEPDPEPGAAPLKGGYRWQLSVGPGEKQELRASYRVRIASKNQLVGGNRRES